MIIRSETFMPHQAQPDPGGRRGWLQIFIPVWCKHLDGLVLFSFVFGAVSLNGFGEQRILGILMIFVFLVIHVKHLINNLRPLLPVPPELKCYTAWVIWAGITGPIVALDMTDFWDSYKVVLQILIMVWVVYSILQMRKHSGIFGAIYIAFVCGGLFQVGTVIGGVQSPFSLLEESRILGATDNPNTLGLIMNWTSLCALFFWYPYSRKSLNFQKSAILILLMVCGYIILSSASRKSAIAFVFLLFAWAIYASIPRRNLLFQLKRFILGFGVIMMVWGLLPLIAEQTTIGWRFMDFINKGGGSIQSALEAQDRYWMYVDGLKIFLEHPIFGVGMYNFAHYFYGGEYSHSNYIEPLATTGLIGFVLYQAFYVCILYRAIRLLKIVRDLTVIYNLKMISIGMLVIMVIGFGAPYFTNQMVYILLTAFMTYTWDLKKSKRFSSDGI
jgi:O-antigen ligase